MRFLLDVNIGTTIAHALHNAGHDVVRAALAHATVPDEMLLEEAVKDDRILVTRDGDFGAIIFQHGAMPPPAVIYIRFEPDEIKNVVPRLMSLLDYSWLQGHITVIGPNHDRRRPFPARSR